MVYRYVVEAYIFEGRSSGYGSYRKENTLMGVRKNMKKGLFRQFNPERLLILTYFVTIICPDVSGWNVVV